MFSSLRAAVLVFFSISTGLGQGSYELNPGSVACLAKFFRPASAPKVSESGESYEIVRCSKPTKELCDVAAGIQTKNYAGVRCLVNAGFDFNVENGFLILRAAYHDAEMLALLFLSSSRLDLEASDNEGNTILAQIVPKFRPGPLIDRRKFSWENVFESAELLLRNGSNPNSAAKNGATPLMFSATAGEAKLVQLLLRHGADPNLQSSDGRTALMVAYDDPATLNVLLSTRPNIYLKDQNGKSAIFYAIEKCQFNKAKLLLAKDQKIAQTKDSVGKIPVDYLPKSSDCSSIKKLLR